MAGRRRSERKEMKNMYEELQSKLEALSRRVAALEDRIKDGKTYVVTDGACDIDDIAEIIAKRLNVETLIKRKNEKGGEKDV